MRIFLGMITIAAFLTGLAGTNCNAWAQENTPSPSVLHIRQSVTTSQNNFPSFLYMYHVLDGGNSTAEAQALTGTISLENHNPYFSEVLWILVYWQGRCPEHDLSLTNANFIWSDILKNPAQSDSKFDVDLHFPNHLPMTGCVGLFFMGGHLFQGEVTMSADLDLTYQASNPVANTVIDLSGEYCFGQAGGCENATADNAMGFGVPVPMLTSGHLAELFGNVSDSTFDGTDNFGPLPTGKDWGASNDFYLLPGGCGNFGQNLNSQGFPNPQLLSTLHGWLPRDAVHLASIPVEKQIPEGRASKVALQKRVQATFPDPLTVNAGDCIVVIYGRTGNGATDSETQVHALLLP